MPGLLTVVVIIAVFIFIIVIAWHYEKKRNEAMQAAAAALEFSFSPDADDAFLPSLPQFHLFSQGYSKKASNVMHGAAGGIDVTMFDYRYTTGTGKSSSRHVQTVILFRSDLLRLPRFTLRSEHIFHKIGKAFGGQDINFESHPEFSGKYLLRSPDEQACRDMFTDIVLGYFDQHHELSVEGENGSLLFYRNPKKVPPADIQSFLENGLEVFSLFKADI